MMVRSTWLGWHKGPAQTQQRQLLPLLFPVALGAGLLAGGLKRGWGCATLSFVTTGSCSRLQWAMTIP
jgi:hypothetical protein